MNPDNQNPNGYQGPNQSPEQPQPVYPQQGVPGQQPPASPQVYGQQYYVPPIEDSPSLDSPTRKYNKKLIIIVAAVATLLLIAITAAVLSSLKNDGIGSYKISRPYDSPVGLVPGLQSADVKSGKFKLTASYVTGGDFTREGKFSVEDGNMYFDMVPDDARVNRLMEDLYDRNGGKVSFDADQHGVNRSLSYDFISMLGYHYLFDKTGGELSGFIPAVESALAETKPDKRFTLTSSCDTALAKVKTQMEMMTTTDLIFELRDEGISKKQGLVSFAALQQADKLVISFFDSCYDLKQPTTANVRKFVDARRDKITKSPTFLFWQEEGVNILEISAPAQDVPFGGNFRFELTELSTSGSQHEGSAGSYIERRNQFGLAYSYCRVDPVISTTLTAGYRFMSEDPAYRYPKPSDTGYYCSTLVTPSQYKPPKSMVVKSVTGQSRTISGKALEGARGLHDLAYEVEQYNINNNRYPGPTEFRDMANSNMGALTVTTQKAFDNGTLVYNPSPDGCVGTCDDFVLNFVPIKNVQLQRTTYRP